MDRKSLVASLVAYGLSEREAVVYLTALELGPSTVLVIARLTGIKRPTVYLTIDALMKKGLVSIEIKGFKKKYKAENPDHLESILEQKKQELVKNLPFFHDIYSREKSDSFIRYYEGIEAIKLLYEDLLKEVGLKDYYLVVGNQEAWYTLDKKFFQKFIEKRAKLNLSIRLLFQDSPIAREHQKFEKNYNEQVKILPKNTSLKTNMVITAKKVIIHQLTQPLLAIVIENRNVAEMNKELFEIMWKGIK